MDSGFEKELEAAMQPPAVVEQATGVLTAYRKAPPPAVLAELVEAARACGVSLAVMAEAVVQVATGRPALDERLHRLVLARWDGLPG